MNPIIASIRKDLKKSATEKNKEGFQNFFKEPVKFYGVKTGIVRDIARKQWKKVRILPKNEIFALVEALYQSGICEESFIVSYWLPKISKQFAPQDIEVFHHWIHTYVNNWASCDGFCNHTVGDFIEMYPSHINTLKHWAHEKNRWVKRAAAVSLVLSARRGKFLKEIFEIADILLTDTDDMVQKGYGWMLKEASRLHQREIFQYVVSHKKEMPRTALRYAIELMPQEMRKKAMEK